jgi:hypothetical protein
LVTWKGDDTVIKLTEKELELFKGRIIRPVTIRAMELMVLNQRGDLDHNETLEFMKKAIDQGGARVEPILNEILEKRSDG